MTFEEHVRSLSDAMLEKLVNEYARIAKSEEFTGRDYGRIFHDNFDTVMEEYLAREKYGNYLTYAE